MINLYDLIEYARGQFFGEPAAQIFTGLCLELKTAAPNQLFVALRNENGDTHRHIEAAIRQGVSGVLCMHPPTCDITGVSVILVRDTTEALILWARGMLEKYGTTVITVTGSSGKTSTVSGLKHALSARYKVHAPTISQAYTYLGIPLAVASLRPEHDCLILRLNPSRPGELSTALRIARPRALVVTNIHHAYIDQFGDPDAIADEIRVMVAGVAPGGLVVLNQDDERVRQLADAAQAQVATVSIDNFGADYMAYNIVNGWSGTGFDLRAQGEKFIGHWTPLLGRSAIYSALAALSVAHFFGIPLSETLRHITDTEMTNGRMKPLIGTNDCIVIDDSYSATPEETLDALDWLAQIREDNQRVIFILGDLSHLGDYNQQGHRQVGQRAAQVADLFITQGIQASIAARAALDAGMESRNVHSTFSVHDTIQTLRERYQLTEDDLILVKGGKSAQMSRLVEALIRPIPPPVDDDASSPPQAPFQPLRPTWIEVDTNIIAHNVRAIKQRIGDQVALMAVVKADAYGHGAILTSQTALLNGAEYLAVANLQEALELRGGGISAPILIMNYVPTYGIAQAIQQGITVTVFDLDNARLLDRTAGEFGGRLKVHVEIDSGMGRMGVLPSDAVNLFRHLLNMQNLEVEGVYTHFSSADEDEGYTEQQAQAFNDIIRPLRAAGLRIRYIHAANSPATFASDRHYFNMVRTGLAMYGLQPSPSVPLPPELRPALTWKTVVAQVKKLPPGHPVGYGNTYRTQGEETTAVICVGYADGFRRAPKTWREVLIHGRRAPVIGRISMEKTVVNVSHIPGVATGDEVVLLGRQGDEVITAEEIAAQLGTINYEVVCAVLPRVPRR